MSEDSSVEMLREPDGEHGMGDILCGIAPDEDVDPVEEVREIRRQRIHEGVR